MSTTPENTRGTSGRRGIFGLLEEFRSRPRPENPSQLRLWIEENEAMLVAEALREEAAGEGPVTQVELTPEVLAKVYSVDFRAILTPVFHPRLTPPVGAQPGYASVDKSTVDAFVSPFSMTSGKAVLGRLF